MLLFWKILDKPCEDSGRGGDFFFLFFNKWMLIIFWEKPDDVYPVVGWVNRFANAGDAALEVAGNTAVRVRFLLQHVFV